MPNGTGVSNIDLSRSPSHSLSPLRFHSALSLSPRSPPSRRCTELGCEQLEGEWRGAREGRVHQEVPAKAQERRTFTSRANTRTCTHQRCETLPGPQPSNLQISPFFFLPFHSSPIPHRLRFVLSASNLSSETYDSLVRAQDARGSGRIFVFFYPAIRFFDKIR